MKSKSEKDYIEQIVPYAQEAQRKYGYLASVLIAQACQENGYGLDNDCLVLMGANNILGMKRNLLNDTWMSEWWDGSYIIKQTPEWYNGKLTYINDAFRKYKDIRSCIMDYCQFMRDAKRDDGAYKYRDVLGITDPGELIKRVRERGYCTDPTYDYSIVKIIAKHNLTQYDLKEDKPMHEIIDITVENHAPRTRTLPIKYIVMHYLGVPNADNPYLYGGGYGGHYNVTRAGKIYKAVDPRKGVVWHCGGGLQGNGGHTFYGKCTNYNSIGIECGVCADTDAKDLSGDSYLWYFTEETQEAAAWLVAQLMKEYNIDIDHVIRHYDVTGKCCLPTDCTEVLTRSGWVSLKDVHTGDEIACYGSITDKIIFDRVLDVVEPRKEKTLKCRGVEATADHGMWLKPNCQNSPSFRHIQWGEALEGRKQNIIKNGAKYDGKGLNLSDDEIRLLVWIQGDGHYIKHADDSTKFYGIEFHISKPRKIARITALLDDMGIEHKESYCGNGSVHIRIYNPSTVNWAEEWLDEKQFSYKFLEMNDAQWSVFFDELMGVDGCHSARVYTSVPRQNIDVVQALCALHGQRSRIAKMGTSGKNNLAFVDSNYSVAGTVKGLSAIDERMTEVSCVTVSTGYILIRQHDNTFIVGNCPNPYVLNNERRTSWTWDMFKKRVMEIYNGKSEDTYMVEFAKVHMGSEGADVKTLQTMLYAMGFVGADGQPIGVDGSFGKNTDFAIREFQKINNLEVDGWCGPLTWARLFGKG